MKPVQPPKLILWGAVVVLLSGLGMSFVGAATTGLSVDEPLHVVRLETFGKTGLYVRPSEIARANPGELPLNAYVYGPVTARTMHAVNKLAGNDTAESVGTTVAAYTVRHLVIAAIALLGVIATGTMAGLVLGSWRWGVVAAGALVAIPMWTGHAMFNLKDTPVAAGNALMSAGLTAVVLGGGRRWHCLVASLAMVAGTVLMVGTRPGMWTAAIAGFGAAVVVLAIGRSLDRRRLLTLASALALSSVALWMAYPHVFGHPISLITSSSDGSSASHGGLQRWQLLQRVPIEWPLLLLAFTIIGTVVAGVTAFRAVRTDAPHATALVVIGTQAFALPIVVIATGAHLTLRHLLFIVPAQAVLATMGIAAVCALVDSQRQAVRIGFAVLAVAALLLPTIVQARLFPYQYTYINAAAELTGVSTDNDKWKTSFRQFVDDVPPRRKAICPPLQQPNAPLVADDYEDCRNGWRTFKPYWLERWHHARRDPDAPEFYALVRDASGTPANCSPVASVTRMRNLERVTISRLLLCEK